MYKERDALLSHLHNSYLAFEEKFGENEKLKKTIQELQLSQKQTQGDTMQVCNFNTFLFSSQSLCSETEGRGYLYMYPFIHSQFMRVCGSCCFFEFLFICLS